MFIATLPQIPIEMTKEKENTLHWGEQGKVAATGKKLEAFLVDKVRLQIKEGKTDLPIIWYLQRN